MFLDHIEEFFLPHMKHMINLVHSAGACVFHHSDGAIRDNLSNMIAAGVDVLDPVRRGVGGMNRKGPKRNFGDCFAFGAMDNQHTLAFGSVEDVHQEVADNLRILGAGGRPHPRSLPQPAGRQHAQHRRHVRYHLRAGAGSSTRASEMPASCSVPVTSEV